MQVGNLKNENLSSNLVEPLFLFDFDFFAGPQDELEYWKSRAARLTLLVEQINTHPCKMTLVTLRAAQSKLLKVGNFQSFIATFFVVKGKALVLTNEYT